MDIESDLRRSRFKRAFAILTGFDDPVKPCPRSRAGNTWARIEALRGNQKPLAGGGFLEARHGARLSQGHQDRPEEGKEPPTRGQHDRIGRGLCKQRGELEPAALALHVDEHVRDPGQLEQ